MAESLIVPIDIAALCVGETDVNGSTTVEYGTKNFARQAADFSMIPYLDENADPVNMRANITEDMLASPFDPVSVPLQQGIHLHWALPDALAHGSSGPSGTITFPEAPNRWLVTRIVTNHAVAAGPATMVKAWVVESDTLWDLEPGEEPDPQNAMSRAVPTEPTFDPEQVPNRSFRMMGRVFPYESWSERPGTAAIEKHTALGYGIPSFAAAYAHCVNVFGMYDPLDDLDLSAFPPGTTRISYMVAGWYSSAANDPLATFTYPAGADNVAKLQAINAAFNWNFAIDAATPMPTSTVCSGLLASITWDPVGTHYINPRPDSPIEIAIGNTTAEALSALVASRPQYATMENVERLLNALQLNILQKLGQVDGLAKLEEALHTSDFGSTHAGTIWMIKRQGTTDPSTGGAVTGQDLLDTAATLDEALPPAIATALDQLNVAQQSVDRAAFEIETMRGQLFVDWYKYMILEYPPPVPQPTTVTADDAYHFIELAEAKDLNGRLSALAVLAGDLKNRIDALTAALAKDGTYSLSSAGAPRYWRAAEPVLLLSGDDLQPSYRRGGGQFDPDALLLCRLASGVVSAMKVEGTSYVVDAARLPKLPASPNRSHVAELSALVAEAFLIDTNQAWVLASAVAAQGGAGNPATADPNGFAAQVQGAQRALVSLRVGSNSNARISFIGNPPSPAGFSQWSPPWIPLMMQWEVDYYPYNPLDAQANPPAAYPADFITSSFRLNDDAIELLYQKSIPSQLPTPQTYRGSSLLTRGAEVNIRSLISNYIQAHPTDPNVGDLARIRDTMQLSMMAQTLDGFNQALVMRRQSLQLPVFDPLGMVNGFDHYTFTNTMVRDLVAGRNDYAPMPLFPYNPLRAGYMRVRRVRIVDAFGQVRLIDLPSVVRSETMIPADDNPSRPVVSLPPRIAQPARLQFRWLSAADDLALMSSDPGSSPIFGWILFNHLDDNLMIYDAGGAALGSFNMQGPFWQGAPGSSATYNRPIAEVFANANPHLKAFALGLAANPNPTAFLADMLAAIDRTATMVEPGGYQDDQGLAVLIGRPLALVRASLDLEVEGLPAVNQSWPAFASAVARKSNAGRDDGGFTKVRFPVRLGDLSQVNDGLIGYFIEDGTAAAFRTFYASASRRTTHGVVPPAFDQLTVTAAPGAAPTLLTMLVDPRAVVHATTGMLPVKAIGIPPAMYSGALSAMAVTFLTAPLLTSSARLAIPLPQQSGYAWSWVTNNATQSRWDVATTIAEVDNNAPFSQLPQSISEGWLKLSHVANPSSNTNRRTS